jgi:hypothetical protein
MPYIHWETDLAQTHVAEWIEEVRLDSEKTSGAQENNFWPSEKDRLEPNPTINLTQPQMTTSNTEEVNIETQDAKENYRELLRRYLFKRRPVHLRRTLDQYYYSHLADTNFRDSDQVVMRQLNEEKAEKNRGTRARNSGQQLLLKNCSKSLAKPTNEVRGG